MSPTIFRLPFEAMASHCEVVLAAPDAARAEALARAAIDEVRRIEHKFSRYRADSIVSRINQAAGGEPVPLDDETRALLEFAGSLHATSGGVFDITAGVLRRAWDFREARVPSPQALAPLLALIGWPRVELADGAVRLPLPGMEIDFGGFGKEYAADRAADVLHAMGLTHGYVNLAGDLRVIGPRPDGSPWQMGIQDPRQSDALIASLPMTRGGLATSGDYERFFERDGRRYCHLLDPRDGQPVTHWRSVSVVAPLAVVAGNCSTIAMLLQSDGLGFLERTGLDYLAVDQHGRLHQKGGH